ncbi:DNA helicase RecG, partial [bacterium]
MPLPPRTLLDETQYLKGVGPRGAMALKKAGIETVWDVMKLVPRRYEDRTNLPSISQLQPGTWATVRGTISRVDSRPVRNGMTVIKATLKDGTGAMALTWFNQPWVGNVLQKHEGSIVAYGQIKATGFVFEISNPEWEAIDEDEDTEDFARIVPVYALKEGLSQKLVRRAVQSAVENYLDLVEEPLPIWLLKEQRLKALPLCLREIHRPRDEEKRREARKRLVFEEFFYM